MKSGLSLFGDTKRVNTKLKIIYNAINTNDFVALSNNKATYRRDLNIPQDVVVLLHIGRFSTEKNHARLLNIFRAFQEIEPDSLLILVGGGINKVRIETLIIENNYQNVLLAGEQSDVLPYLAVADLFVLPSLYEGIPLVLIEAQTSGLPVITSDTVSRESDIGNGLISYLSLSQSDQYWAAKIAEALAKRNIQTPKQYVTQKSKYDIKYYIKELVQVYG